jgi:putative ABC transport system permease protein
VLAIATFVSIPLAFGSGQEWLSQFAYSINIGAMPFIIAVLIALAIVFFTVGFQAIKASRTNPVNALKSE